MSLITFSFVVRLDEKVERLVVLDSDEIVLLCRLVEERHTKHGGSIMFSNAEIMVAMRIDQKGIATYYDSQYDAMADAFYCRAIPTYLGIKVHDVAFGESDKGRLLSNARFNCFDMPVETIATPDPEAHLPFSKFA